MYAMNDLYCLSLSFDMIIKEIKIIPYFKNVY